MAKEDKKELERMDAVTTENLIKTQSEYKGNSQLDRVTVKAVKNGNFMKKDKEYSVHPTTALIMQEKGLIEKGWEKDTKTYNPSDNGTSLQDKQVTKPQN